MMVAILLIRNAIVFTCAMLTGASASLTRVTPQACSVPDVNAAVPLIKDISC